MTTKNYLILCAAVAVVTPIAILLVPPISNAIETVMLVFLATTAS